MRMSLRDVTLKTSYSSNRDDIVSDFYIPVLKEAISYKRAVGYFSSSSLCSMSIGICELIRNGGSVKLIASPKLSLEDIEAINNGLKKQKDVIQETLIRELQPITDDDQKARLNFLSNLIAIGKLEIKIAMVENNNTIGMFHVKNGIIEDASGNAIAFTGSMNESFNGFYQNFDDIEIFTSWSHDLTRVNNKKEVFESIWNNKEPKLKVERFPEIDDYIIKKYKIDNNIDLEIDNRLLEKILEENKRKTQVKKVFEPKLPSIVEIRPYQNTAIRNWRENNYCGIFDMATGTGKTYTALAGIVDLFNHNSKRLAVIIVCPYQHLVEQWTTDIRIFGMQPIICYSTSKQSDWYSRLQIAIQSFKFHLKDHFCMVTTNATFALKRVQDLISQIDKDSVIVIDEAHNFGAENLKTTLPDNIPYRLALSATLDRYGDEDGTSTLYRFFGNKCIEYTLKDAIDNDMLTPYKYYPVPVYLTDKELNDYVDLTNRIIKNSFTKDGKKKEMSDHLKMLLIKRARIVAGAANKVNTLKRIILNNDYQNDYNILVYCGATTYIDPDFDEEKDNMDELRQIDAVTRMLGYDLDMKVARFTSQEDSQKREEIKSEFAEGKDLQAVVAIKCLDEGVNIPSIKTAFILASSTNPKEYIQRRGRVLRKYHGKEFAEIFDFITLPIPLEDISAYNDEIINASKTLAKREFNRMDDFSSIALNPSESDFLKFAIQDAYSIFDKDEEVFIYD